MIKVTKHSEYEPPRRRPSTSPHLRDEENPDRPDDGDFFRGLDKKGKSNDR